MNAAKFWRRKAKAFTRLRDHRRSDLDASFQSYAEVDSFVLTQSERLSELRRDPTAIVGSRGTIEALEARVQVWLALVGEYRQPGLWIIIQTADERPIGAAFEELSAACVAMLGRVCTDRAEAAQVWCDFLWSEHQAHQASDAAVSDLTIDGVSVDDRRIDGLFRASAAACHALEYRAETSDIASVATSSGAVSTAVVVETTRETSDLSDDTSAPTAAMQRWRRKTVNTHRKNRGETVPEFCRRLHITTSAYKGAINEKPGYFKPEERQIVITELGISIAEWRRRR